MNLEPIQSIRVNPLDFLQIELLGNPSMTFSCNEYGDVWPFVTSGYTPPRSRRHLRGQSALLDEIVRQVLGVRPLGGRFRLSNDGVRLASDHTQILVFA